MKLKHLAYVLILAVVGVALLLVRGTTQQISLYHFPPGTTLPDTCFLGDNFIKTDAATGQQIFVATSVSPCVWTQQGIPPGSVNMRVDGTCPIGWAEVMDLNGRIPVGTLAANGNVGTIPSRKVAQDLTTGMDNYRVIFCKKD